MEPAHNELTEEFLKTVAEAGTDAAEVFQAVHSSVVASSYLGRALGRPVFLNRPQYRRLIEDTDNLYSAITGMPGRLHGGDLAAFGRSIGMTELQIAAILRNRTGQATRLARADLCLGPNGFQLVEMNIGSTLGGLDNALLNEGMLSAPHVGAFVAKHGLTYVDTLEAVVETLLAECEIPAGTRPVMAAADWPESFETLAPQLHRSAAMLVPLGLDAQACHVGQLRVADGRVWLGDKAVDVIYRLWTMEDQHTELGRQLIEPLNAAADRGEVKVFTPMDGRLFGNKGILALVSDEENRHLLTPAERASVDRALPWTRMLRSGPVTAEDGRTVDLAEYAISEREQLILKPTALYGGKGVVPGWLTEPGEWRERIEAALDTAYLVQRRITVVPELFPTENGFEPWTLVWGVFLMREAAGGIWVRGTRGPISGVAGMTAGGTGTCCFHEPAD